MMKITKSVVIQYSDSEGRAYASHNEAANAERRIALEQVLLDTVPNFTSDDYDIHADAVDVAHGLVLNAEKFIQILTGAVETEEDKET